MPAAYSEIVPILRSDFAMHNHVLVIDDDPQFNELLCVILSKNGYQCVPAYDVAEAWTALESAPPDLILLDVVLKDDDGTTFCRKIHNDPRFERIPVIFVTGTENEDIIFNCYQSGGADYIGKPIRAYELLARIKVHLTISQYQTVIREIENENLSLKDRVLSSTVKHPEAFSSLITANPEMRRLFTYVEVIAPSHKPVLLCGESGVGKELFAGVVHRLSGRAGDLVNVNVAGLDDQLFSDTLFGHQKGAYTGADTARSGLIEKASGGTLFLDEIGDLRMESQLKLLRLLQHEDYYPLGGDEAKRSKARIVVATNHDLTAGIAKGTFREDLYYRLMTHEVRISPLRERKEDIPLLVEYFVNATCAAQNRQAPQIPVALVRLLETYDFPGNVRELESMIIDAVSRTGGGTLATEQIASRIAYRARKTTPSSTTLATVRLLETDTPGRRRTLRELNDFLIAETLTSVGGNIAKAAAILGVTRQALYKRKKAAKQS